MEFIKLHLISLLIGANPTTLLPLAPCFSFCFVFSKTGPTIVGSCPRCFVKGGWGIISMYRNSPARNSKRTLEICLAICNAHRNTVWECFSAIQIHLSVNCSAGIFQELTCNQKKKGETARRRATAMHHTRKGRKGSVSFLLRLLSSSKMLFCAVNIIIPPTHPNGLQLSPVHALTPIIALQYPLTGCGCSGIQMSSCPDIRSFNRSISA